MGVHLGGLGRRSRWLYSLGGMRWGPCRVTPTLQQGPSASQKVDVFGVLGGWEWGVHIGPDP